MNNGNVISGNSVETTYYGFLSHIKAFLRVLLTNPIDANIDSFLKERGFNKSKLLKLLLDRNIIEKEEKINDADNKFIIKYKVPKKDFERKIKRLHSKLFEVNIPKSEITEDGEGATSAAACNASAPITAIGKPIKRTFYFTEKQIKQIKEATTTFSAGDYQYTTPFMFRNKEGKKDDAYIHRKVGGIACERLK